MDLKTKVSIEITRGEGDKKNHYQFIMQYGVPLGEAYDVCHEVLEELVKMAGNAAEKAKQKKDEPAQ